MKAIKNLLKPFLFIIFLFSALCSYSQQLLEGTVLDEKGEAYNINADTAAGAIARGIKSRRLILLTDVEGVMRDNKLIPEINTTQAKELINNQTIHGGMIPKMKTCIDAINNGVRAVVITDGRKPHSILFELFSDQGAGTLIRK